MPTQEALWPFYQIQRLDAKIALLERQRAGLDEGTALGQEVMRLRDAVAAAQEAAQKEAAGLRDLELQLASVEEKQKRIQGILYDGKSHSPKELQGYEAELASLGRRKDALEDQILGQMDARDEAGRRSAEATQAEAEAYARYKKQVLSFRKRSAEMEAERAALVQQRDALRAEADPELLRAYDKAARQRKLLVGRVESDACGSCGMLLPGRMIKEYQSQPDSELTCPTCSAFLLWRVPEGE